jgi:DNA-directed RNA polymerase specialized sigma54-like protein
MNCSLEQVNRAIERMSKLDTSPGLLVGRHENPPVTADVIVESDEQGGYAVRLADAHQLNLRVNNFYEKMARHRGLDDQTRQFSKTSLGPVVYGCHPAAARHF